MQQGKLKLQKAKLSHGGRREGAGRPNLKGEGAHNKRPNIGNGTPARITLLFKKDLPNLRTKALFAEIQKAAKASKEFHIRIIAFCIQKSEIHLMVEAFDNTTLTRGIRSLSIRLAKNINSYIRKNSYPRKGSVYRKRYELKILRNAIEFREQLSEIMLMPFKNSKKKPGLDQYSSSSLSYVWRELLGSEWKNKIKIPSIKELKEQHLKHKEVLSSPRFKLSTQGWRLAYKQKVPIQKAKQQKLLNSRV